MHTVRALVALASLLHLVLAQNSTIDHATYTNPILDAVGADPWVIRYGDYYYLTFTNNANITLYRSRGLTCVTVPRG